MKLVILAGGKGHRFSEETLNKPKPMIEIGEKPILWHIMKYYSCFGVKDFIICGGYLQNKIKDFFENYKTNISDVEYDLSNDKTKYLNKNLENWKVKIIDTGLESISGGRLLRVKKYLKNEKNFFLTYGDGLSNININKLLKFHLKMKKVATISAVKPPGRFGAMKLNKDDIVESFSEKFISDKKNNKDWINGGFCVLTQEIFKYLKNDKTNLEHDAFAEIGKKQKMCAYKHDKFWQCMDTLKEKLSLEELWKSKKAPWKIW